MHHLICMLIRMPNSEFVQSSGSAYTAGTCLIAIHALNHLIYASLDLLGSKLLTMLNTSCRCAT